MSPEKVKLKEKVAVTGLEMETHILGAAQRQLKKYQEEQVRTADSWTIIQTNPKEIQAQRAKGKIKSTHRSTQRHCQDTAGWLWSYVDIRI